MIIYINTNFEKSEITYTGISFCEFLDYLEHTIDNLLIIKGDYIGNRTIGNFELIEGVDEIDKIKKESIIEGDFSCTDYSCYDDVKNISDEQIANFLFTAHMFKPLTNPFYSKLKNNFVYLSHDDSYFCKVIFKQIIDFSNIINKKILEMINKKFSKKVKSIDKYTQSIILEMSSSGILFDFNDILFTEQKLFLNIFSIGKYDDIDFIKNNISEIKKTSFSLKSLVYDFKKEKWYLHW